MNTKIFTKNELSEAAAMIRNGGIVVMPTETVYGLAANAFDAEAVEKVFAAKGRQADNPLIVHIANNSDWEKLVEEIPPKARQLADRFWPGPLTIILKKKPIVPDIVSGGLDTVAVRMPKNKIAFRFIRECGCPLAAPSANLSGCPSPTKLSHVMKDMNGRVDGIIEGGDCMVGLESTVISLAGDKPIILRPGRITAAQISKVIGEVEIHHAVTDDLDEGEKAASPGMKYKHYAPNATVTIVDGDEQEYINFIKANADEKTAVICFSEMLQELEGYNTFPLGASEDSVAQSKRLFDVLRAVDDASLEKAYAPMPSAEGVGLAVNNRLLRAAGFNVIKLNSEEMQDTKEEIEEPVIETEEAPEEAIEEVSEIIEIPEASEEDEKIDESSAETPIEELEEKQEKPTLTTKKAVKDKKPDIRPKREKAKKVEDDDDDAVQVIGLGENGEILGISADYEEDEPIIEPEPELNAEPKSEPEESQPAENEKKKGKKHKKNKKKQKREQQKKAENKQANSPESDVEPDVVQTVDDEFIPDFEVDNNIDDDEPDFVLLDEKFEKEESAQNDLTLQSLNELTLSADFNDDFSKEISENIIVVEPNEENANPLKHISDIILKDDDIVADVKSPVIEEAAEEIAKEDKKAKKGFFKSLFVKRSQKRVEQYQESIAQAAATPDPDQPKKEEPKKEEPKKEEPKKEVPKKEEPKKEEPKKEEPKKEEPKKEEPEKEEPKKEEPKPKKEPKKEDSSQQEKTAKEPKHKKSKKEKAKMQLLKNKEPKKAKPEEVKLETPKKEVAKKAKPIIETPKKEEAKKVEPKKEKAKKPEPLSADQQSANSLSKDWKYNPEKNKQIPQEIAPEENFKSSLSADDVKFETISYEKFNKPLTENSQKKGKADNKKAKINELSVQLINQQEPLDESETIAHELKEKDILGIKLDVKKDRPDSVLKADANIEDTVGNIKKVEGIKVIGVTGKTGAGKGVVTRNLAANKKDTAVIDADKLYHALLKKENMEVSIVFAFGQSVVGENGGIDRKKLATVAFSSEANIRKLNRATHPYVAKEIIALIEDSKKKGIKTIYLDAPTLIESGLYRICDEIIFIKSPKAVRKKRIIQRDNLTDEEAEQRMRFEKNDKFYLKYANKVIEN